ncbi:hypothetical protein GCM10023212_06370 [Luteolibacter yonseiensis]
MQDGQAEQSQQLQLSQPHTPVVQQPQHAALDVTVVMGEAAATMMLEAMRSNVFIVFIL